MCVCRWLVLPWLEVYTYKYTSSHVLSYARQVRLGIKEDIAGVSESVDKLKEQLQEKDNYYTKQVSY